MTFFDFVMGVSMGAIIANAVVGQQFTSTSAVIAFVILSILTVSLGYLHIKSLRVRKLINSEPVILVENGTIIEENLTNAGLDKNWLTAQLNSQNIKDASEVFYAGLDNTKKLHISKKSKSNSEPHGKYGIE